jgi:hypothetical protein
MTRIAGPPARGERARTRSLGGAVELVAFALLAYVPFLASSPGKLSADTKEYLYLDPSRLLSRAAFLWDPHVGAGTVPHQGIGYLFPMGPYYWLLDRVGVPDWIAQRFWLGSISLLAALGARWLFLSLGTRRAGAIAGALVYMLTPYQLAFTARISVLLLPWAGLPWLVGLTMRATKRGGWRDPALFALVILLIGGVNASSLVLVLVAPLLWLVLEACAGRDRLRAAVGAAWRIGVLSLGVSLWWMVGLRLQGAYGMPVLQLTENVRTVASASRPDDILRGLGNWFFYGTDRLGYSLDQASSYVDRRSVVVASYAIPVLGLLAAGLVRWRHRTYFALLVIVGTVIGVGAWPYDDPSAYGSVWKDFSNHSSVGLALRNTPRVGPVVVLGFAALLAAAVSAIRRPRWDVVVAAVVAVTAFAALLPVWRDGYLSKSVEQPDEVPAYWKEAAAAIDRGGTATRVLEIPGANFSAYRWGNTVEPVTPGLTDRPYLAREVLPYGSPQSVNLLDALDRRMQEGTFEPASLAPVARFFGVGTVVLRSDLQYERFDLPRPKALWAQLTEPLAGGLAAPQGFGRPVPNLPPAGQEQFDERDFATSAVADPPPVALFGVEDPVPIVRAAPVTRPVVLSGDGDGIVDASAGGILDGRQQVFELAALDGPTLRQALSADADIVMTDSNRRRIQNWFYSLQSTKGATERAGQTAHDPNGYDYRLDVFPGSTDADRTVVEQLGGRVDATSDGGAPRPEDRPVRAFDGDTRTSWRVGGADPTGARIVLRSPHARRLDRVTLLQPQDGPRDRTITEVRIRFDHGPAVTAALGDASLSPPGQTITFPARTSKKVEIEIVRTSVPPFDPALANAVGFSEIRVADTKVREVVRLPVDVARRIGARADGHRLDVVVTRLRFDPSRSGRQDEELSLDRRVKLPDARSFELGGTARIAPNAPDAVLDRALGTTAAGVTFTASSHLAGDAAARASRAFDDDPATAWTSAIGPQEVQWLDADLAAPVTASSVALTILADGRHSVPTRVSIEADGRRVATAPVPEVRDASGDAARHTFSIPFPATTASRFRLVIDAVRRVSPHLDDPKATLPVAVVEARYPGVPVPARASDLPAACRDDLVKVDGRPVSVRVDGAVDAARTGIPLRACSGPIALTRGNHDLTSSAGLDTGIDVDRIVLASGPDGAATPVAVLGTPLDRAGARTQVTSSSATAVDVRVKTDGKPFWLVLGESANAGWHASVSAGRHGARQVANGYANAWLVTPKRSGTIDVSLRWTPQRLVWFGIALSIVAILACVAFVLLGRRRALGTPVTQDQIADEPGLVPLVLTRSAAAPPWLTTLVVAAVVGLVTDFVAVPWVAVVAAVGVIAATRLPIARGVLVVGAPVALAASRLFEEPELAWLALALLGVELVRSALAARIHRA